MWGLAECIAERQEKKQENKKKERKDAYTMCTAGACGSQRDPRSQKSDPLELELQTIVSYSVR